MASMPRPPARSVVEGILLASYRYVGLKNDGRCGIEARRADRSSPARSGPRASSAGAEAGRVIAGAASFARELANTPPTHLNAKDIAAKAVELGPDAGLTVEVFNKDDLASDGLRRHHRRQPGFDRAAADGQAHLLPAQPEGAPGDGRQGDHVRLRRHQPQAERRVPPGHEDGHVRAAACSRRGALPSLSAMSSLKALGCRTKVTAWLMCTDNMPSGSALKLGDVLTMRNGKTVEIHNTDAEGRLVLADGLSLAVEEEPDAIVDIATLTGAVLGALGPDIAGLLGTNQDVGRRGQGVGRADRRADLAAAARDQALPQAARLRGRRHAQHRRPVRRHDHRDDLPLGVHRRRARTPTSTSPAR